MDDLNPEDYDDPIEASKALDQQIWAIPRDRVFTKRTVVAGFCVVMATLGLVISLLVGISADTNDAVTAEIPSLKRHIDRQDETISDLKDINGQAVDWIVELLDILNANGIEPPQIRIEPKD